MMNSLFYAVACSSCDQGGIYAFSVEDLTQTAFTPYPEISYTIFSSNKSLIYAAIRLSKKFPDDGEVAVFAVGENGKVKFINSLPAGGLSSCHVVVNGSYLYCPNYSGGTLAEFKLASDGSLKERTQLIKHSGSSIHPTRQTEAHPHCVCLTPDGSQLAVVDLGCDKIFFYAVDPENGINPDPAYTCDCEAGTGPRHIIFNSAGDTAYVINELGNSISVYAWADGKMAHRQTLSTLPPEFKEKNTCAAIRFSPDGNFLIGTNRGHDSLAIFKIGTDNLLSLEEIVPSNGNGPRDFDFIRNSEIAAAANEDSKTLNLFSWKQDGKLTFSASKSVSMPRPLCVLS